MQHVPTFEESINGSWLDPWISDIRKLEVNARVVQAETSKLSNDESEAIAVEMENKVLLRYNNDVTKEIIDQLVHGTSVKKRNIRKLGDAVNRNYGIEPATVLNAYHDALHFLQNKLDIKIT